MQREARLVAGHEGLADARDVAETLMAGIPVLLDLTSAEGDVAKRILDFSTGVVFGLGSGMHRVDRNVFLLTPSGTEVTGLMQGMGLPDS